MQTIIRLLVFGGLLVSGATPQLGDELLYAVKSHNRALVSRLLEAGADVNHMNYGGYSALMIAAGDGEEELVSLLLASGALVDQLGHGNGYQTPMTEAVRNRQVRIVKILLLYGADVNKIPLGEPSPLHMAASRGDANGDSEIVSVLIENNADVNLQYQYDGGGYSPLAVAARCGNPRIVSRLLRAGADVNSVENYGTTALMLASCVPDNFFNDHG